MAQYSKGIGAGDGRLLPRVISGIGAGARSAQRGLQMQKAPHEAGLSVSCLGLA